MTPKAKYKAYKGDMNGVVKSVIDKKNHKTYYQRDFETSYCIEK